MLNAQLTLLVALVGRLVAVASGLECYTCASSTDVDCARKPGKQLEVEECPNNDQCVTTIISGVTHRGCLSKVIPNKICSKLCEKCSTSLCNVLIFPVDRLLCYQCFGSECIDIQNRTTYSPAPCPVYKETDQCYTNVIGINTVRRGCVGTDLTSDTGCTNICLRCNYDGCNTEVGVSNHYCYECSYKQSIPSSDFTCLRPQQDFVGQCAIAGVKTCANRVLHGNRGKCFTYVDEETQVVNRGCSSTMGFYPNGNVTECYGEYCNSNCMDIMCNVCDNSTSPDCRNQLSLIRPEKCNAGTHSCFSCEAGQRLWRGCGSNLPQPKADQICYGCQGSNGCNNQVVRSCYKCSSFDNENCASWNDISTLKTSICSHAEEKCVSTLVSRLNVVYTLRGCESHVNECTESDPFCDRCDGSLCNVGRKVWELEPMFKRYRTWLPYYKMQRNVSDHLGPNIIFLGLAFSAWFINFTVL